MAGIFSKLKAAKPAERTVELEGETILVVGLTRSKKNELQTEATDEQGKLDGIKYEAMLLAECCRDPSTREPIEIDYREWDLPAHLSGPLVAAVVTVCGFDESEHRKLVKKSETTPS